MLPLSGLLKIFSFLLNFFFVQRTVGSFTRAQAHDCECISLGYLTRHGIVAQKNSAFLFFLLLLFQNRAFCLFIFFFFTLPTCDAYRKNDDIRTQALSSSNPIVLVFYDLNTKFVDRQIFFYLQNITLTKKRVLILKKKICFSVNILKFID